MAQEKEKPAGGRKTPAKQPGQGQKKTPGPGAKKTAAVTRAATRTATSAQKPSQKAGGGTGERTAKTAPKSNGTKAKAGTKKPAGPKSGLSSPETGLLDARAALGFADSADDAALKKLGLSDAVEGEAEQESAAQIDPGLKEAPEAYRYRPEEDARPAAVKSDFSAPGREREVVSPVAAYADVTAEVLSESPPDPPPQPAPAAPPKRVVREGKVRRRRHLTAQADYAAAGLTEAVAKSDQYLRQADARRRKTKLIAIVLLSLLAFLLILFGVSAIVSHQAGFTVNLSGTDRQKGLALFDNASMENGSSRLVTEDVPECDNRTYSEIRDIALTEIDLGDGQQSRNHWFFAYSFYVKNEGRGEVDYQMTMEILSASHGVDDAVRVMVIEDSLTWGAPGNARVMTVAAKPASDPGSGEWLYGNDGKPVMQRLYDPSGAPYPDEAQDNARPFAAKTRAVEREVKNFSNRPGQNVRKYTILVYLEGGDPDCNNNIKGGGIKFRVEFEVTGYRAEI